MSKADLIRFVSGSRHPPYGHRSGIFQIAYNVSKATGSRVTVVREVKELLDWFENNLTIPSRFAASRRPRAKETALSWIRSSANEHIVRLRRLVALVETFDFLVEELRTNRPGYVLYEDEHQVVGLPFADTVR